MTQTANARRLEETGEGTEEGRPTVNWLLLLAVVVAVPVAIVLGASQIYRSVYADRIYLGVTAGDVDMGGYSPAEARAVLVARYQRYAQTPITIRYGSREWKATPAEMGLRFEVDDTIASALAVGRSGSLADQIGSQLETWQSGESARQPIFHLDATQRAAFFDRLTKEINRAPVDARLTLLPSELRVKLTPAQLGLALNVGETTKRVEQAIAIQSVAPIAIVVEEVAPAVPDALLLPIQASVEKMMSAPLVARFEDSSWKLERSDIADLLSLREQPSGNPRYKVEISDQPLQRLVSRMAQTIDRRPSNARFDYAGGQLKVIREGLDGRTLDRDATIAALKARLSADDRTVSLPVRAAKPAFGAGDGAKLRIAGVIDQETTSYAGSIPERAYNVELAASRLHGVVVGPGETFSFNDEVGQVNTLAGYKVGYGITQEGGNAITVPSVGGGICQVATTLFHPVFWAGYQIGDRVPHLYWIPKYGLPPKGMKGLDTTVDQIYDKDGNLIYAVDFTFKNTSPDPILIQAKTDGKNVSFTLLGTKPDWQVKADGPVIENVVPAITGTLRQEDPTMAAGRTIMIEEAREGFKSTIVRTVTRGGQVIDKRSFVSEYVPTRDVWLVGTKKDGPAPAAATPLPSTVPAPKPTAAAPATPAARATPSPTPARR